MEFLIVIIIIGTVLFLMALRSVIRAAIDHSQMARDLADIREMLLESRERSE